MVGGYSYLDSMLNCFGYFYKHTKLAIILFPYFQFPLLFAPYVVSKCEIRCLLVWEHYISRLYASLVLLILNATAKTMLAMLAFLYYGEFVEKYSTDGPGSIAHVQGSFVVSFLLPSQ